MGKYDNRSGKKDLWAIAHNRNTFDITILKKGQVLDTIRDNIDVYSPSDNNYEKRLGNFQRMKDAAILLRMDQRIIETFIKTYIESIVAYISDDDNAFYTDITNDRGEWLDVDYNDDYTVRSYFLAVMDGESDDSFNI